MNIAICDDEENIRIYIRKLIQKQEPFCKITEFSSGKELLEFQDETNAEEIDILFLDIDITDAAYKRMQTDPEYEKKILDALAKNKAVNFGNYIPQISYMHIDDTYEKCYGYTQGMKENDGYSRSSSAKGTDAGRQKKARQKELLEEYLEKRAQMKEFQQEALEEKIAKQELERSRLTKVWSSKRQMAAATNAYESNVMTETSTGSNSLLG